MVFSIGYDNTESESKFYITYKYKKYGEFISNLLKMPPVQKELAIEFNTIKSPFSMKYAFSFKNLFFKNFRNSLWTMDVEIFSKKKLVRMVNFDILPGIKFSFNNNSDNFPISFSLKHGMYQASRDQIFEKYDITQVIPSLLPYSATSMSVIHNNSRDINISNHSIFLIYRGKIGLNRIHLFEDNIKLSGKFKMLYKLNVFDKFDIDFTNETLLQQSFILKANKEHSNHHVLSGFDCLSKILGMSVVSSEQSHILNPGTKFCIKNNFTIRLSNFSYFKDNEIAQIIQPFFGIESIYLPYTDKNKDITFKDYLRLLYTFGISLKIADSVHLDFMLYTSGINIPINHANVNKFRVQLDISANL